MKASPLLLTLLILLSALAPAATVSQPSLTIGFNPPSLPGGAKNIPSWTESGFFFSTPEGLTHKDNGGGNSPSNGGPYLRFLGRPNASPLTILHQSGYRFDFLSADLAHYSAFFSVSPITFVGFRNGQEVARQVVNPSSIVFQTFAFSPSFNRLDQVQVLENGYAIDNVTLSLIPEPSVSTLALALLGIMTCRRKR